MSTITQTTVSSANTVLAVLAANGGMIIDDHNHDRQPFKATHVARFAKDGKEHIVQVYPNTPFCINPVTIGNDGYPHLKTMSIGGTIRPDIHESLDEAIAAFNDGNKSVPWDAGKITEVIAL